LMKEKGKWKNQRVEIKQKKKEEKGKAEKE
jgi:hypothetical protein